MFNKIVESIFEGIKAADTPYRDKREKERSFQELDTTPYLFSSGYLDEMYGKATKKAEYESILGHMNRHAAWEVDSYKVIEKKIIDKYWR